MKHRALVVEDDPEIAESVADTLESIGHEHVWVKSQDEARQMIGKGGFTYVLLDLQIPVRFGRGLPCIEFGEHLAREIHESPAMQGAPMIVMTAYGKEGLEIAAPLCQYGVVDFINKPFGRPGRTLASVIQAALARTNCKQEHHVPKPLKPKQSFQGGVMVFYPDRVELLDVKVCGGPESGIMRTILEALRERRPDGGYKAFSGAELARRAGADRGQNAAAEAIRRFRQNVKELLLEELNIDCAPGDVIKNDRRYGYRFSEKIEVRNHDDPVNAPARDAHDPTNPDGPVFRSEIQGHDIGEHQVPDGPVFSHGIRGHGGSKPSASDGPVYSREIRGHAGSRQVDGPVNESVRADDGPVNGTDNPANQRLCWVREQLAAGEPLRREDLERQFGVSMRTAKRDFQVLRDRGEVEFVGPAKSGYYRLVARRA